MNKPDKAQTPEPDKSKTEQDKNQKPEGSAPNLGTNNSPIKDEKKR